MLTYFVLHPTTTPAPHALPPAAPSALALTGSVARPMKLGAWGLWEAMGRPKFVCAPMVEQSELPFRLLCRRSPSAQP
jgi:hypothetical protein